MFVYFELIRNLLVYLAYLKRWIEKALQKWADAAERYANQIANPSYSYNFNGGYGYGSYNR